MSGLLDTIIIGAGWAGVVASRYLAARGYSVLVLEARERIGGRARTFTHGMHSPIDLGCSWIHGGKSVTLYNCFSNQPCPVQVTMKATPLGTSRLQLEW